MKKVTSLLLISLLLTLNSRAQTTTTKEFSPQGASWHYNYDYYWGESGYYQVNYVKDTLVEGKMCKKLSRQLYAYNQVNGNQYTENRGFDFLYQEGEKVYFYYSNSFNLVYDFSLQVGDTLTLKDRWFGCDDKAFSIDSIGTTIIHGDTLKFQVVNEVVNEGFGSYWPDSTILVEKIGCLSWYHFPAPECITDSDFQPKELRCYTDDASPTYAVVDTTLYACDYVASTSVIKQTFKPQISPNPAVNQLQIELPSHFPSINIQIYNTHGQLIKNLEHVTKNLVQLDCSDWQSGIYLCSIVADGQVIAREKLVVWR